MDFSKHTQGTTSVKVHHAPGGKSNFSLGWDTPEVSSQPTKKPLQNQNQPNQYTQPTNLKGNNIMNNNDMPVAGKTSIKVHNPPGGRSNFVLG